MNERLSAALAQRTAGPEQRRYLRALRHDPLPFRDRIEAAQVLMDAKDYRLAALWYASALRGAGEERAPAIGYRLGNALRLSRHERAAAQVLEGVCTAQPEWGEPAHSLAWLYRNAGQASKSADVMERWLNATSLSVREVRLVAGFMHSMGLADRAEGILARMGSTDPVLRSEHAKLLLNLGQFEKAEKLLLRSLEQDPSQGGAWLRLAHIRRWESVEQSPNEALQAVLKFQGLDDSTRAAITFALVKVNDDVGRYEQAWAYALEANTLRHRSSHFDRMAWMKYENDILQLISGSNSENNLNSASTLEPIFMVGMPRSGSMLLERCLGRHSRLKTVGELEFIESIAIALVGDQHYPWGLAALSERELAAGVQQWRASIPGGIRPGLQIIDKNPFNYMNLWFISKLFPKARIIHCRRDPMDTALSIWFQNFAHLRNDYAYNMADLTWVFGFYQRLMTLWQRVLPQPILTLDYESLVDEPEGTLRQLVDDLDLDWEDAVLEAPGQGEAAIAAVNLWQTHATVRARNYEPWTAPLREALQREGIAV